MKRLAVIVTVLLAWAGNGWGQAMVEHAAAAGVGSAGSAGGKMISDGLDKVFGKVEAATREAAGGAPKKALAPKKEAAPATGVAPVRSTAPSSRRRGTRAARPATAADSTAPSAPPMVRASMRPAPTPQEFAMVAPGAAKREVVERLGAPAYKIVIPDEGHLVEIYRYTEHGRDLGRVRVVDGTVAEVQPAAK